MNGADTIATYPLISAKQQRRFTAKSVCVKFSLLDVSNVVNSVLFSYPSQLKCV